MADIQITGLPAATSVTASDLILLKQGGVDKKATPDLLVDALPVLTDSQINAAIPLYGSSEGSAASEPVVVTAKKLKDAVTAYAGTMLSFTVAADGVADITLPDHMQSGLFFIQANSSAAFNGAFLTMCAIRTRTSAKGITSLVTASSGLAGTYGCVIEGLRTESYSVLTQSEIDAMTNARIFISVYEVGPNEGNVSFLNTFSSSLTLYMVKLSTG